MRLQNPALLMVLNFDEFGYLLPYDVVKCDMSTLKSYFVDAFPLSTTRQNLWNYYQQYIDDFRNNVTENFTQWLDGSFFTQVVNPKDIDLVTFIDVEIFQNKEAILEEYWSFALEDKGLDAYLVEVHPLESSQHITITKNFRRVWQNRFGKDRNGRPKGFIQINW